MTVSRRDFLTAGAASAAVISSTATVPNFLLHAAAAEPESPHENILVVVQLSGGNDGLNTVVPFADDVYHASRFATRLQPDQVLKIDDYVGLHPAMRGMAKLIEDDSLAIIQGVGYPNPNRSHFESMDIWHTASRKESSRRTGWLGRYIDGAATSQVSRGSGFVPAIHLGSEVQPLALAGLKVHAPSIGDIRAFRRHDGGDRALRETISRLYDAPRDTTNDLLAHIEASARTALATSRRIERVAKGYKTPVAYPSTALASKLRSVAQLIDAQLPTRVYYVTLNGFDTHSEQSGAHAGLLRELSGAMAAFVDDLSHHGHLKRVLVVCFSEFGRRVKENSSRGTDHGAAAPMFLAGGRVRSGLIGKHPSLTDLSGGDVKFHTDFRSVYAAVLEEWLGVPSLPVLGARFKPAPLFDS